MLIQSNTLLEQNVAQQNRTIFSLEQTLAQMQLQIQQLLTYQQLGQTSPAFVPPPTLLDQHTWRRTSKCL